jgi:endonuclease/exonuclease/phosphatase family metal-dependent hydrolase
MDSGFSSAAPSPYTLTDEGQGSHRYVVGLPRRQFSQNFGMRIDHLLVTAPLKHRIVWAEIDREAWKGKPLPSDHAPLVIDIDSPGCPFDAGWSSAYSRIAARPQSER